MIKLINEAHFNNQTTAAFCLRAITRLPEGLFWIKLSYRYWIKSAFEKVRFSFMF